MKTKLGDTCKTCLNELSEDNVRYSGEYINSKCTVCLLTAQKVKRGLNPRKVTTHCKNKECGVLLTMDNKRFTGRSNVEKSERTYRRECKNCEISKVTANRRANKSKKCVKCLKMTKNSDYSNGRGRICINCLVLAEKNKNIRVCNKCQETKNKDAFNTPSSHICLACANEKLTEKNRIKANAKTEKQRQKMLIKKTCRRCKEKKARIEFSTNMSIICTLCDTKRAIHKKETKEKSMARKEEVRLRKINKEKRCQERKDKQKIKAETLVRNREAKITANIEFFKYCSVKTCGAEITDSNRIKNTKRSICKDCHNKKQNTRRQEERGYIKRDTSMCLDCKTKKTPANTRVIKTSEVTGELIFESRCTDCKVINNMKYQTEKQKSYYKPKKKRAATQKKTVAEEPVIFIPNKKLSTSEKMNKILHEREAFRKSRCCESSDNMIAEFLENKSIKREVAPSFNTVAPYQGKLISTKTFKGNQSKYGFD